MKSHPVRLLLEDDLERSRVTVFFRLILVIPHAIWIALWGVAALVAAVINWFATLAAGRSPDGLHRFLAAYVRYSVHVNAYIALAADPYPDFRGRPGYPVDVEIDDPATQERWKTAVRLLIALPALVLSLAMTGSGLSAGGGRRAGGGNVSAGTSGAVLWTVAFLGWFACLARGAMPRGLRNLQAYQLGYAAQTWAYLFLLTDRYPNGDPEASVAAEPLPYHPVRMALTDDLRRSRLTVLFRLPLVLPHIVWLVLWGAVALVVLVFDWAATLVLGRSPSALHRFFASLLRYQTHVGAFLLLVGNPFPGFTGAPGSYPVDIELEPPVPQKRATVAVRALLALPAFLISSALSSVLDITAVLGWFASLVTGRMPRGLRNLGAFCLRYSAQTYAYLYLLTSRYPYSGPPACSMAPEAPEPAAEPTSLQA